ncbi:hypothetical protein CTEN210_11140 [Chaetoceros tenuissimus]|uniref:Uncharacterized protein n=1 Tax=Chaetoceros tenuissimus TaxID=426638 RepID=A0AAD3H995_9STRA|nr:hypothetical protein CTEN210_11140 [Chaetoceros tenuissimus]
MSTIKNHPMKDSTSLHMGIFDDLKLIFSEEGQENRKAYEEQQRREQEEAQRIIMERRRNPETMAKYEDEVKARRSKLKAETEVWDFQTDTSGADPLETWEKLRAEGKIKAGSDIERDPTSSRLGSEGLQEVRTDDKLPYIEQGYVDENADVFKNFKKMFGGKD